MNTVTIKAAVMAALFSSVLLPFHSHADELSVEERLDKLEKLVNSRSMAQNDMQQQIDSLTDEVYQLRGSLEEANYKLQQATERQKGLYQELDKIRRLRWLPTVPLLRLVLLMQRPAPVAQQHLQPPRSQLRVNPLQQTSRKRMRRL